MYESEEVFLNRTQEAHIQYEETRDFFDKCHKGEAFSGIDVEEETALLNDLENDSLKHSNDMIIELILQYVSESTKDEKLLKILNHLKIASVIDDSSLIGRAYPKYSDGSYYIEMNRDMERRIRLLSDLFAVIFMRNENLELEELITLNGLYYANLQRYKNNEEYNSQYNFIQLNMILCDKVIGNQFTDKYVAYAREIQEMATAFFIGHEIGHHYYEHTTLKNSDSSNAPDTPLIDELKADSYGIEFAFEYLKSAYKSEENIYSIHQFAGIYIPLISSSYFCNDITKDTNKHPSIIKRMILIQRTLNKLLDQAGFCQVKEYILLLCKSIDFLPEY